MSTTNPLLTSSKTSDSRLSVQLHPMVILTISDYITRHILRQQTGPIAGAIIGQQNGRDITMEHAFECKLSQNKDGEVIIDETWFHDRLQQYKDVHKAPALDLVGWFTLTPPSGPQPQNLAIHQQLSRGYNESILLLTFHPESVAASTERGGKLPLTVYESVYEAGADDDDSHMREAGEAPQLALRFKELPYTIETGEAEMIAVDFVARGGGNATAVKTISSKAAGKAKAEDQNGEQEHYLTAEDEDAIATLTTKANAIRMLQQRLTLLKKYLQSLPASYLNDPSITTCEADPQISHTVLRSIASLLARLPLLTPSAQSGPGKEYAKESAAQAADVALISLLGSMGSMLQSASQMGKKAMIMESSRNLSRNKGGGGVAQYGLEGEDEEEEGVMRFGRSSAGKRSNEMDG